jgi:hypothetical protein
MVTAHRSCAVKSIVYISGDESSRVLEIVRVSVVVTLSVELVTAVEVWREAEGKESVCRWLSGTCAIQHP